MRVAVALVPVVVGLAVGEQLAGLLGTPEGWVAVTVWWTAVLSATVLTVLVVEHAVRHLLPLSLLLRLSLLFPDRAPSRFKVALRASTVRRAERALAEAGEQADPSAQAEAALALVAALHVHDRRTRGHSERVRALTVLVGREMGLDQHELDRLEWAGLLHDIGKLTVPPTILNKAGPPDDEEWSVLRRHPGEGGTLTAPLADWLGEWVHGVDQHHEDFDGTGYPRGLAGEEISLAGRIVAVTDALETMTASRAYKRRTPVAEARAELVACAGAQFDPAVVRAVLAVSLPRLVLVLGPVAALVQVPLVAPVARSAAEVQGALAAVVATTPRALATVALALGTLGGGPAATVASADSAVTGLAVGDHAPEPTGGAPTGAGRSGTERATVSTVSTASVAGATGPTGAGGADDATGATAASTAPRTGTPPTAPGGSGGGRSRPPHDPPGPPPTAPPVTNPPPTTPPATTPPEPPVTTPPPSPPGLPAAALACLGGGWVDLGFPNQGLCLAAHLPG